jgi:hypothetical protein
MKAITMRIQKFSRPGAILLAAVVAIITSIVAANAAQTFTTPNSAFISYSLAAGASSAPITPVTNRSVLVMGCCTTSGDTGVGQVSLLHSTFIRWVGFNSSGSIANGASATAGTNIVQIDGTEQATIQVASANTILIHNGNGGTVAGNVTLVW